MHRFKKNFLLICIVPRMVCAVPLIDLEDRAQDFVLETKQIIVPGFPGAFNASIIRWQGSLLMSFRIRDANMVSTFQMGLVWLDEDFNPITQPTILDIRRVNGKSHNQHQDPRLIIIKDKLYILYSSFTHAEPELLTRRMFIAPLCCDGNSFFIEDPVCIHPFEGASKRWEKNWVPFNYHDTLLLSYSLTPHQVFKPSLVTGECETLSTLYSTIDWDWGEIRGGTPALLDGKQYVAFFHSSKLMESVHSQGKKIQHYFMGAYTFSAKPPFRITRISTEPIVGKNFYHGAEHKTWKPVRVVFPMGCIADDNYFWVSYGRQDFEIWVAKIDKKGLYKSLLSVGVNAKSKLKKITR